MTRQKVLVTGASGFLGRALCPALMESFVVVGADLAGRPPVAGAEWLSLDSPQDLARAVDIPDISCIVHLAFINRKPAGQTDGQYLEHLLSVDAPFFEAAARRGRLRVVVASSSAVYGKAGGSAPLSEDGELRPVGIYGLAKVLQERLASYHAGTSDLRRVTVRMFNLVGPGQPQGMLVPDWARKARAVLRGEFPRVMVKHMRTTRDFLDVRDAASAITAVVKDFADGEIFNLASGVGTSLTSIAQEIQSLCRGPIPFVEMQDRPDSEDVPVQVGDAGKFRRRFHWAPRYPLAQSLSDFWKEGEGSHDVP